MKALTKTARGTGNLALLEVPTPRPREDEVLIRVSGCGLCGTDLAFFKGSEAIDQQFRPNYPIIIGHEFVGEVVDAGPGVARSRIGQMVAVNPHLYCGSCAACQAGKEEICSNRSLVSWDVPGGAAEFVAVRACNAYEIDSTAARAVGMLAEPFAVAVHALDAMTLRGESLLILGAGAIGCLTVIYAMALGIREVVIAGLPEDEQRLQIASELGATSVILSATESPKSVVDEVYAASAGLGEGFEAVVEASGGEASLSVGLELLRRGGRVGVLGIPHHAVSVDLGQVVLAEKVIAGIRGYTPRTWRKVVRLIPRFQTELATLVTHSLPLGAYAAGFDTLESRAGIKVVLHP